MVKTLLRLPSRQIHRNTVTDNTGKKQLTVLNYLKLSALGAVATACYLQIAVVILKDGFLFFHCTEKS